MKQVFVLLLAVSAVFSAEVGVGLRRYYGAQVLRVTATTQDQFEALKELHDSSKFDFWSSPSIHHGTDIMAEPEQLEELHHFLGTHGIAHSVMIKDVEELVSHERIENNLKQSGRMDWNAYQRFDTISAWLDELGSSPLVTVEEIGTSTEGRELKLVKISSGSSTSKRKVFIDSLFHAREWISGACATYIINELVTNAAAYADLLANVDFYVLPVTNPDGYEFTHTSTRMWRKTRSNHNSPANCRGVDPNRNFAFQFGGAGTSNDKCSDIYRGPEAFSEPETRALANFINDNTVESGNFTAYLTIHSYGQYWLVPWGYASGVYPPDWAETLAMAQAGERDIRAVHGTPYAVGHSADMLYPAAGASDDWAKGMGNIAYSYTLELRDTGRYGFILPPAQIIPTAQEVWAGIQRVARDLSGTTSGV